MRILVIKKRSLYITVILLLVLAVGLFAFMRFSKDSTVSSLQLKYTYRQILPEEARALIDNNPELVILDVRSQKEYNQGHISNAVVLSYKELKAKMDDLDQSSTYLVYDSDGKDSLKASKLLAESGYSRVFTLVGGYKKWPYEIKKIY